MAAAVLPHFKQRIANLVLVPSEDGRFEVSVDGKLIYSKLETGRFPEHDAIIRQIETVLR